MTNTPSTLGELQALVEDNRVMAESFFDRAAYPMASQVAILNESYTDQKRKVEATRQEMKASISSIQDKWLRYADAKRELGRMEEETEVNMESVCEDIRKLSTVKDCTHQFSTLFVMTHELVARNNPSRGEDQIEIAIAPHLLTIPMSCQSQHDVKFICLGGMHYGFGGVLMGHPHCIDGSFSACLGGYTGILFDRLRHFEYLEAVEVVLTFLQTFDPEDPAGAFFTRWPRVGAETPANECDPKFPYALGSAVGEVSDER